MVERFGKWPEDPPDQTFSPATGGHAEISLDSASASTSGAPLENPVVFSPGKVLAERFRVVRFIARGGMGEVYEAEDFDLRDRVAIKTISFERMEDREALERFRREIQLARRVTHINVCRIFELFRHEEKASGSGVLQRVAFVSMELLSGTTLDTRIRREGPFTVQQALPIVEQMAAGLEAAHQAGIVHRDFKSSNVVLVPRGADSQDVRAVITDFGLARSTTVRDARLTGPLDRVGTPAYMAPEQLLGGPITPATDVYALGIVLFEMLTGRWPFVGESPHATANKRLVEPAPQLRAFLPDVEARWEAVVARCLEREASQRFSSALEVVRALQTEAAAAPAVLPEPASGAKTWVQRVAIAALGALALLGVYKVLDSARTPPAAPVPAAIQRTSVAVLDFKNLTAQGGSAAIANQLFDGMSSELDTAGLRAISPGAVREMEHDLFLKAGVDSLPSRTLEQVRQRLDAQVLVYGSFSTAGTSKEPRIRWDVRLQRADTGVSLGTVSEEGTPGELFSMIRRAGARVREKLGVTLTEEETKRLERLLATNEEASRLYSDGLAKLQAFDLLGATRSLELAAKADPNYPLPYVALAQAWKALGYGQRAREAAKRSVELGATLSPERQRLAEAISCDVNYDWPCAMAIYEKLAAGYPDNPEYVLLLARVQKDAGVSEAALKTLAKLRTASAPLAFQARLDIEEADAYAFQSQHERQLALARSALGKAAKLDSRLLMARARVFECQALERLVNLQEALRLCEDARRLNQRIGDNQGVARASTGLANALWKQGKRASAEREYREALQVARKIGSLIDVSGALNNFALVQPAEKAEILFTESLEESRKGGDKVGEGLALGNLANVLYDKGDFERAVKNYQLSFQLAQETGHGETAARAQNNLCSLQMNLGNVAEARKGCEESLRLRSGLGNKHDISLSHQNLGDVLLAQNDSAGARAHYEQALRIQQEVAAKGTAGYSVALLARLSLQEGRLSESRDLALRAVRECGANSEPYGEVLATHILAEALLGLGDVAGARAKNDEAAKRAKTDGDASLALDVAITAARIDAARGSSARALSALEEAQREARRLKLIGKEMEVRLALGELLIRSSNAEAGRSLLGTLASEAKKGGFARLAQRAERLSSTK